ncbi:MAG: hypothetical protein HY866_14845 [Chloroflexi bacterium]|nr:hypothetical protein [Chloroflexota bacterium]
MKNQPANPILWITALTAALLYSVQTALADSDLLTVRYVINILILGGVLLIVMRRTRRGWRAINGPAPDPISLILAGGAMLCLWAAAWWIMSVADRGLTEVSGPHPTPRLLSELSDSLLGIDLQSTVYELQIVAAVVLVPLIQAALLWGLLFPELLRRARISDKKLGAASSAPTVSAPMDDTPSPTLLERGSRGEADLASSITEELGAASSAPTDSPLDSRGEARVVWLAGLIAGIVLALTAVQNVTVGYPLALAPIEFRFVPILSVSPELPWGLVALVGYSVVGVIAAWAVYFSRSPWAGFVVQATFAYTSFALRDNLTREFAGKDLLDVAWLTLVILGMLGAVILLQAIRFRTGASAQPSPLYAVEKGQGGEAQRLDQAIMWLVLLAAVVIMAVVDFSAR